MKTVQNPFPVSGYGGAGAFCDRESELRALSQAMTAGRHTVMFSIRRIGKTALIQHLFEKTPASKAVCIYSDIHATNSRKELIDALATAVARAANERASWGKRLMEFLKSLRPVFSYNDLTGLPEVTLTFSNSAQEQATLENLLKMLNKLDKQVFVAIDEFQRITAYPEKTTEALLRSVIQTLRNVTFLFSGSQQHLLMEMFGSASRPFFAMTQSLKLGKLQPDVYGEFIRKKFVEARMKIDAEAVEFILEFTRAHTYYTQLLCNSLFDRGAARITLEETRETCHRILTEQEPVYFNYRNMLTAQQWKLLAAIAKEEILREPTSGGFLGKYGLGNASSVRRGLEALLEKEMVYEELEKDGTKHYSVYDVFLSRWLERNY